VTDLPTLPTGVSAVRAVLVPSSGAADVLHITDVDRPSPGAGQVLVRVSVAGVNYMDVYQRSGVVSLPTPFVAGVEGVGVVVEAGSGVDHLTTGHRVGWLRGGQGSYAEYVLVDAAMAVPLPEAVPDEIAAAVLMQGVTAQYLATDTYPVQPGDTVLVHSAAGGVGQLLTQVVKLRGGRVIGTVSTEQKAEVARASGADEVLRYEEVPDRVKQLTGGKGVAAVYDGVGGATFDASLASLRPRGVLVVYGTSSGPTPPLEIPRLNSGGSLYVTRPTVVHYTATRDELRARTDEVFGWVASGQLRVSIGGRYPLADAARAHEDLQSRRTTGKLLLFPAEGGATA
jgi:NADPH2:quinone reductase